MQHFIDLLYKHTEKVGLVDFYLKEVKNLERKDSVLRICDLDDTLFARKDQLEAEEMLRLNRGDAGNTIIINTLGIHSFAKKHYHSDFPKEIFDTLDKKQDLILTAGTAEIQYIKLREMGIEGYNIKIVPEGKDKILATFQYICFELGYIPKEIIVYEDRPEYFIEFRALIETVLQTELTIYKVKMDGNTGYKQIEAV